MAQKIIGIENSYNLKYIEQHLTDEEKQIARENIGANGGASGSSPIGAIIPFSGEVIPPGFLLCDGAEYSKEDFEDLYKVIGDLYTKETASTGYFNVPDLRGKFAEGANGNLGADIAAGLPNIEGVANLQGANANGTATGVFTVLTRGVHGSGSSGANTYINNVGFDASKSNSIYGNSDTVQPPALAVNFIIKATRTKENLDEIIDDTKQDNGHAWSGAKISEFVGQKSLKYNRPAYENRIVYVAKMTEESFVAPQDGFITYDLTGFYNQYAYIKINDFIVGKVTTNGNQSLLSLNGQVPVRKGDVVAYKSGYSTIESFASTDTVVFIPYASKVDEPPRQGIQYQVGEVDTGKTWIDGKPIYRYIATGCNFGTAKTSWSNIESGLTSAIYKSLNINTIVDTKGIKKSGDVIHDFRYRKATNNLQYLTTYELASDNTIEILIIEYTKTTDEPVL